MVTALGCLLLASIEGRSSPQPISHQGAESWRSELAEIKQLAENDAPAALEAARSLQKRMPGRSSSVTEVLLLNLLSRIENHLLHSSQAMAHAQGAHEVALLHGDRVGQAEASMNMAYAAATMGNLDQQEKSIAASMEMLEEAGRPELLGEAMWLAVASYWRQRRVDEAVTMALHALEVAKEKNDPVALTYAHWGLVKVYAGGRRYAEAAQHGHEMHRYALITKRRVLEASALVEWGNAEAMIGRVKVAEQRMRQAIAIDRAYGMRAALCWHLMVLADHQYRQQRYEMAIDTLDEVVRIYTRHPHKTGMWWARMARSEYIQGYGGNGQSDAMAALQLAREINHPYFISQSGRRLAEIDAGQKQWREAYLHTVDVVEALDRAAADNAGERIMALTKKFKEDSHRRRIDALAEENEHQQMRFRWMVTVMGVGTLMFTASLLFLAYQRNTHRRLMEAHMQLQRSQEQLQKSQVQLQASQTLLRALGERAESIRESERRYLAREVHDELGQMLNVLRLNLLVMSRRFGKVSVDLHGMIDTLLTHVANAIAMARNIVTALYPTVLDAGIVSALDWLAEEFGKSSGMPCMLELDQHIDLDQQRSMAVYRIVQESLTNVARHAKASQVKIVLSHYQNRYRLEISDDGQGFDPAHSGNGNSLGLVGMRERARMLQGIFELSSRPAGGTTIRIDFPVVPERETA